MGADTDDRLDQLWRWVTPQPGEGEADTFAAPKEDSPFIVVRWHVAYSHVLSGRGSDKGAEMNIEEFLEGLSVHESGDLWER